VHIRNCNRCQEIENEERFGFRITAIAFAG
jgi:hypothetical protein